jgi:hypothetical protein
VIRALTVLASAYGRASPCERARIAGVDALTARPAGGPRVAARILAEFTVTGALSHARVFGYVP